MINQFIALLILLVSLSSCTDSAPEKEADKTETVERARVPANETEAAIYKSADSMTTAFKNRDWKTFVLFTHPAMVRVMGGADGLAFMVQQQMQEVPDSVLKRARIDKVLQVEKVDDELQCVVEENIVMEMDGKRITSTTYLIGESLNQGKSWTFFDASNTGQIKPLDIKPNLSPGLKIPAKKQETTVI